MAKIPIDEHTRYAIRGRIATLDKAGTVIDDGVLFVKGDKIEAIQQYGDPLPEGYTKKMIRKFRGTLYPGMVELHNHLSYNIIPTWQVPKTFLDRDQWRRHPDYKKKMTGPLKVLGSIEGYLQAIVRYVECKLLFSGVTASQGITLASHAGIRKYYKGLVRNVEQTIAEGVPSAKTRIADIKNAQALLKVLERPKTNCYLLHLAEGVHHRANKHFKALQIDVQNWAIRKNLAGIHAVGLLPEDFAIMGEHEGSMVWSPMSNLLLYGTTAHVRSAKEAGVRISIGSDWSASGSKNLLSELKVAKLISDEQGGLFTDEELVRMVTTVPANMLQWDEQIGSLEPGKKADFIVLRTRDFDQSVYEQFIRATEKEVGLVVIGGAPVLGYKKSFMDDFDIQLERIKLKRYTRYLNLSHHEPDNPLDVDLTFKKAKTKLKDGMRKLPKLALDLENNQDNNSVFAGALGSSDGGDPLHSSRWVLAEDHSNCTFGCERHHLEYEGMITGGTEIYEAAVPLSEILKPLRLDEAVIHDDRLYFKQLAIQKNLPQYIKLRLPTYYGVKIDLDEEANYREEISRDIGKNFNYIQSLPEFYKTPGYLNLQDRITIIEQAETLFEYAYVNLPQKMAMYASNPIAKLRVMKADLLSDREYISEIAFHKKLISIFNSVRDLHTSYSLPAPFNDKIAFLPFFIEEYYEGDQAKYAVSKFIGAASKFKYFRPGVEVTHWNGMPIDKAIMKNGENYAGSNNTARFVRGLDAMTFRPTITMLPPEEDWVDISYIDKVGIKRSNRFYWRVGSVHSQIVQTLKEQKQERQHISYGYDYMTLVVHMVKKFFFSPKVFKSELNNAREGQAVLKPSRGFLETSFPGNFKAKLIKGTDIGYIRIYSFSTTQPEDFAYEFKRLIDELGTRRIVIDVRSNGGGNILAAEYLLQVLSPQKINPQTAAFLINPLTEHLCKLHSPSNTIEGLDLTAWYQSLLGIKKTGAKYTLSHPITSKEKLRRFATKQSRDLVLITDALCYSATDLFAAGFKDHNLGKVLGVHDNTGAGGANVWTHSLLYHLTQDQNGRSPFFERLPYGADFRIAIRRTLRVRKNQGIPVEDLGIQPDEIHRMTKNDLLNGNEDLIRHAVGLFEEGSDAVQGEIPQQVKWAIGSRKVGRRRVVVKADRERRS